MVLREGPIELEIPFESTAYSVIDPPPRRFKKVIVLPDGGKIKIYIYTTQLAKTIPIKFKLERL